MIYDKGPISREVAERRLQRFGALAVVFCDACSALVIPHNRLQDQCPECKTSFASNAPRALYQRTEPPWNPDEVT